MTVHGALPRRSNAHNIRRAPSIIKKSDGIDTGVSDGNLSKPTSPPQPSVCAERTVKKLRLSKALTISEGATVADACRRMSSRRVTAVLLTDANTLLSGILTDKDIATRVVAEGLRPEQTIVSKIMTRNPVFVNANSLATEALQKMAQGKFRHLPVVENGEVIALLDITKCLYDAISKMEKYMEQGSAIAAAVESVDRQWGNNFAASSAFIETLRERMFKPSLSTVITESSKLATVLPSDPVHLATRRMKEFCVSSVVVVTGNKLQGILTSKDVLIRVVAQSLSPELTPVEKVMTANPDCAMLDTTVLDALHIMRDGKFLHLPVLDKDGCVAACVDVLQITHISVSMIGDGSNAVNDMASTLMQKFWDSALALEPPEPEDGYDTRSELSALITSETGENVKSICPYIGFGDSFTFKLEDHNGYMHRFGCGIGSFRELVSVVLQRLGFNSDQAIPKFLYEDHDGDKVLISSDADLASAVDHARSVGWKVLRLHLDYTLCANKVTSSSSRSDFTVVSGGHWAFPLGLLMGAAVATSMCLLFYFKRSK